MQACREARSGGESGSQQPEVFEGMCEDFATALARPFVSRHDHFDKRSNQKRLKFQKIEYGRRGGRGSQFKTPPCAQGTPQVGPASQGPRGRPQSAVLRSPKPLTLGLGLGLELVLKGSS